MNVLVLKIIACATMLLDHIGYFLPSSPTETAFRLIGRVSMPIFCFLIVNGYRHSSNPYRYMLRLLAAALISEIPFNECFRGKFLYFNSVNVMVTLLLGLTAIFIIDHLRENNLTPLLSVLTAVIFMCIAEALGSNYGFYGVILIILFYIAGSDTNKSMLLTGIIMLLFSSRVIIAFAAKTVIYELSAALPSLGAFLPDVARPEITSWAVTQLASLAALPLILLYNGKVGPAPKNSFARKLIQYGFYLFYPLHLIVLALIF